jgi:multiple sugar transport system ATP-binding protein
MMRGAMAARVDPPAPATGHGRRDDQSSESRGEGIELVGVSKRFGSVEVIANLDLQIEAGEFLVVLGPSGCGKSTLLRMIAGLESVTAGKVHISGRDVTQLAPGARGVAMVFQHYALYPHMTVYDNLAFGMRNVGVPKDEIDRRIQDAVRVLELEPYLARRPAQLSGGQRQRVAIGRALVKEPVAFLFDEPLSNLDAGLRARTRVELARLHHRLKTTMVFVTHDQAEAMTLATRLAVMNRGRIEQIGSPMEIYRRPATRFVASFIGTPAMNFLSVDRLPAVNGDAVVKLRDGTVLTTAIRDDDLGSADQLTLGVRAESVSLDGTVQARGRTDVIERLGDRTLAHLVLADGSNLVAQAHRESKVAVGEDVGISFETASLQLFDGAGKAYHAP